LKEVFATYLKTVENLKMANDTYVIELILDHKGETGDKKYLIKWEKTIKLLRIYKQNIFSKKIIIKYWAVFHVEKDGDWRVESDHSGSDSEGDVNNLLMSFTNVI
jgi:hypothetical protein